MMRLTVTNRALGVAISGGIGLLVSMASTSMAIPQYTPDPVTGKGGYSPPHIDHSCPAPLPDVPDTAQVAGEHGDVIVGVLINSHGHPRKIAIQQSSGFNDLDNLAAGAVASWHYLPAMFDGDKTSGWMAVKIQFQVHQAPQMPALTTVNYSGQCGS